MGGYGSGRHSGQPATSHVNRVDIRHLRERGLLRAGASGTLNWTCGGEDTGSVGYRVGSNTLTLGYKTRQMSGDWEPVKLTVPLVSAPCRYGGKRYYFRCPNQRCQRRCEILYLAGRYFLCRKCCGYIYACQQGCDIDRLIEAKHKLGRRIFEDYDGYGLQKKKGMHWRTFDRLQTRYRNLDNRIDAAISARYGIMPNVGW